MNAISFRMPAIKSENLPGIQFLILLVIGMPCAGHVDEFSGKIARKPEHHVSEASPHLAKMANQ